MVETIRVRKAAVYHNTRRLTPAQVKKETGCTHIMNAWLFDNRSKSPTYFKPCGWLVINGKTISKDQYNDWGFACGATGAPRMSTDRTQSYIAALPLLKDGKKLSRSVTPDVARKAQRTAVGWTKNNNVILWCDSMPLTIDGLRNELTKRGAIDAIMFDGGGSTQGIFNQKSLTSSRKVATMVLFWEDKTTGATTQDTEPKGDKPMVEINAYSLKHHGNKQLSSHFKVKEFKCYDGSDAILVAPKLVMVLESIRTHFAKPVIINSAYRTPQHNTKNGGAPYSQHCYGTAADISIKGVSPATVAKFARQLMPDWGGVGIYKTFTHIDVRDTKSDWNG